MATLDKTNLKASMLRDKGFLKKLYNGSGAYNLKTLQNASDIELSTLIKVLFYITNGEIKIKKQHFDQLMSNNKVHKLRANFESKSRIQTLLKSERLAKLKSLRPLIDSFSILLYPLFNE